MMCCHSVGLRNGMRISYFIFLIVIVSGPESQKVVFQVTFCILKNLLSRPPVHTFYASSQTLMCC